MIVLGHAWQLLMIGLALYAVSPAPRADELHVWSVDRGVVAVTR